MRMKSYTGAVLSIGLMLIVANAARGVTPILVNFDSFTGMGFDSGTPIPVASRLSNQLLAADGVLFSSGAAYVPVLNLGVGHATSGTNGIGAATAANTLTHNINSPIPIPFWDPH